MATNPKSQALSRRALRASAMPLTSELRAISAERAKLHPLKSVPHRAPASQSGTKAAAMPTPTAANSHKPGSDDSQVGCELLSSEPNQTSFTVNHANAPWVIALINKPARTPKPLSEVP